METLEHNDSTEPLDVKTIRSDLEPMASTGWRVSGRIDDWTITNGVDQWSGTMRAEVYEGFSDEWWNQHTEDEFQKMVGFDILDEIYKLCSSQVECARCEDTTYEVETGTCLACQWYRDFFNLPRHIFDAYGSTGSIALFIALHVGIVHTPSQTFVAQPIDD